ncbi:porin [Ciceribacter sp. L1K22]|uniref:porin n=1 Tax=Ciceribacter sp. L1K22 TaxID=2820275 RepID=UPI001ABE9C18|nr:porin [Ciceribacter sp. L1K22]MBO3759605.1 porin [Ciceribacter sp. L1K22]
MNIKSLLIGSAAALAVVSGAQAADAIVAAEPEPMEYVRVCDAFGTGFFYIPGTETCLRVGGEVRVTVSFDSTDDDYDWDSAVRSRVYFDARNDSEIGTIGSYIRLQGTNFGDVTIDQGYITIGGFKIGAAYSFWDDIGIAGETDAFADLSGFRLASYTYASDAFTVGVGVDDLSDVVGDYWSNAGSSEIGLQAMVSAALGPATVSLWGVYDFGAEDGAIYGKLAADVGPGTFELGAGWSSGENVYVSGINAVSYEWTVAAAYAFKATDKLTITPSVSYWEGQNGADAWGAGLFAEYALAEGLTASATVDYLDADGLDDEWTGFVRLTRSF